MSDEADTWYLPYASPTFIFFKDNPAPIDTPAQWLLSCIFISLDLRGLIPIATHVVLDGKMSAPNVRW